MLLAELNTFDETVNIYLRNITCLGPHIHLFDERSQFRENLLH